MEGSLLLSLLGLVVFLFVWNAGGDTVVTESLARGAKKVETSAILGNAKDEIKMAEFAIKNSDRDSLNSKDAKAYFKQKSKSSSKKLLDELLA